MDIRALLGKMPRTLRVGAVPGGDVEFTSIQSAINYAASQTPTATARWTVLVWPGVYTEQITMAQYVDAVAVGAPENTAIQQADGTVIILNANGAHLVGFTIQMVTPTVARNVIIDNGVGSQLNRIENCIFNVVNNDNSAHRFVLLTGNSNVLIQRCRLGIIGGTGDFRIVQNDTNSSTVTLIDNEWDSIASNGAMIGASVASTWVAKGNIFRGNCPVVRAWTLGTYLGSGNQYLTIAASNQFAITSGSFTEKSGPQQYKVMGGMLIQHAITAAAADSPSPSATRPYTIILHPGVYDEVITPATFVHIRGIERDACIIQQADTDIVTVGAITFTLSDVTLALTAPSVGRRLVSISGAATLAVLRNVKFSVTPLGVANTLVGITAAATLVVLEDCGIENYTGGVVAAAMGISITAGASVFARRCSFNFNNTSAFVYSVTNASGSLTLLDCEAAGTATHLRASAGTIRVRNSQYRSAVRSGTGVIIDETPSPKPYAFRAMQRNWDALIANANVATRVAVGGSITSGGSGQVVARINDNAADAAGVESPADATGALASTWTPARCPRYVMHLSADALRATTTAFFGLRATLGAAVPGAAEHHAGFIWTGAAFNASSSNGAGVGATTALSTPSTGAEHTLEVIIVGAVQVEFYVDGVLVATHATAAGVPTSALSYQEYQISSGAGGATTSNITLREGWIQECLA